MLNTARQAGSLVGVALFGSLAAANLVTGLRTSVLVSFALGVAAFALTAVIRSEDIDDRTE